ncbi:hypothetical protein ES703_76813 [subsurface metagenome]
MKEIEEKCRRCNEPLRQMKWNKHCDIVLCDNVSCAAYREPVRVVQRLLAVPEEVVRQEIEKLEDEGKVVG